MVGTEKVIVPQFPELDFEEKRHVYTLNGDQIPSVSSIMKPLSNALYGGVDDAVLNKAADRGTAVHNAIETFVNFGMVDIPEEFARYFEAFKAWWDDVKPTPLATECRVYHKILRYAGTADMPVMIGGKMILVDFKTSAAVNKMLTGVQLEAYAKAYASHGFDFDGKAILHLKSDGKYGWKYYPRNDTESWEVYTALLTVYRHIKKHRGRR